MFRFPQISPPYGAIMHENEIAPTAAPKEIPWNKGRGQRVSKLDFGPRLLIDWEIKFPFMDRTLVMAQKKGTRAA